MKTMAMPIRKAGGWIFIFASIAASPAAADGPDRKLIGKSIIAFWTETNGERDVVSGHTYEYKVEASTKIYTSDTGQIFVRYDRSWGGKNARSFSTEEVFKYNGTKVSESDTPYKIDVFQFNGGSASIKRQWGDHGAQLFVVAVASNTDSCAARFLQATDATGATEYRSPGDGRMKISISRTVERISCAIKPGNVFD
jgi:hypothetical protein